MNEPDAALPEESVAVQFTFVCPRPNVLPEPGLQLTPGDESTLSVAPTENETAAPDGPAASMVLSAGSESVGAVLSTAVTVNEPDAVFLFVSVALQLTVVVRFRKTVPEGGLHVTSTIPSTASPALGAGL